MTHTISPAKRRTVLPLLLSPFLVTGLLTARSTVAASVAVLTQHNDNARTGANLNETLLTPTSVKSGNFGKLFTLHLDANVNGQPLFVPGMTIAGGSHNVLFLTTSNNTNGSPSSAYAFDADKLNDAGPLWRHQFPASAQWTTCTPALDPATSTMYVLTKDQNDSGPTKLHALDMATGNEKTGSPIVIAASVPGTGDGSKNGIVTFDTSHANCRPGLLVLGDSVYFAFAHNSDSFPYHGWVFSYKYDGTQFTQTAVFNTCPNGGLSGIWQSGKGIAADADGNLYFGTGNGTFDINKGGTSYGMCYLKLSAPNLKVLDWYAPSDEKQTSDADLDVNNSGPLLLPGTTRLFAGATKFGSGFLLDTTHLGGFNTASADAALQRVNNLSSNSNVGQNPVAWDAGATKYVYLWPSKASIEQLKFDTASAKFVPTGIYKKSAATNGGSLTVTANGATDGILWAVGSNGVVHAYDATDVSQPELWSSAMNSTRDSLGSTGHFQFPTVVNGKAYIPTGGASVVVYGLPPVAALAGDVDGSGTLDIKDAILSLQIAVGIVQPTAAQKTAADFNNDGVLDLRDTLLILRSAVGA